MTAPESFREPDAQSADRAAQRLVRRVLQQWWLIALCAVVAAVTAYLVSSQRAEKYQATSTIEIAAADLISTYLSDSVSVRDTDPERLVAAAVDQLTLLNVRRKASVLLGGEVAPADIEEAIAVTSVPDSSTVKVVATSTDPELAKRISNATVDAFIAQRKEIAAKKITDAQRQVKGQFDSLSRAEQTSTAGNLLQAKLRQVDVLGTLSDGNVTIIQGAAAPSKPASPKPKRDAILGFIAGLLLGTGIALLRARLDDRVRDTDELTEHWDLPIVGIVPQSNDLKQAGRQLPEPAALEALSLARTNLRYLHVGGSVKTLLITSAVEGEGKSTLTWNLAVAAALAKSKVLVVEADLRRPKLSSRIGLGGQGLSEVLAGLSSVGDAIQSVDVEDGHGGVATTVDVMPAGMVPPSPIALLESDATVRALAEMKERYDVVLIDSPPATVVADAVALVERVDGVLIVSRLGTVRRAALKRLREILTGVGAPVVGRLVNSDAQGRTYGYYTKPAKQHRASEATAPEPVKAS